MSLEFTRLSQLTGDPRYFDAVQRIADRFYEQQNNTRLPGLWPVTVNARRGLLTTDRTFTFGGMADSLYEYLPKVHWPVLGFEMIGTDQVDTHYSWRLAEPVPDNV